VKEWELYHIKSDRIETNNLAKKNPEKFQNLKAKYSEWAIKMQVK
jgi:arylsulfatase